MDSLDLPTHQLILNDLALSLAEQAGSGNFAPGDAASAFVGTRASGSKVKGGRPLLTASAARTQISLALFASSIASGAEEHLAPVVEDLLACARELTTLDVEETMDPTGWPLPDQLAFAIASALLRIAGQASVHRTECVAGVIDIAEKLTAALSATVGSAQTVIAVHAPMFHGLYRALAGVAFHWSVSEFASLATALGPVTTTSATVKRLNDALMVLPEQAAAKEQADRATRRKAKKATVRPRDDDSDARSDGSVDTFFSGDEEEIGEREEPVGGFVVSRDEEARAYSEALLAHYRAAGRPLTGHFVLCAAIEGMGSVLAQALAAETGHSRSNGAARDEDHDADHLKPAAGDVPSHALEDHEATRRAWATLLRHAVPRQSSGLTSNTGTGSAILNAIPLLGKGDSTAQGLSAATRLASRVYHDLQRFIESEGPKKGELFADLYALEALAEALKLGSLASVAQARASGTPIDSHIVVRIRGLLSEAALVFEPLVQISALQSTGVLVRNFPALAMPSTTQLRRFVTSPLAMFEAGATTAANPVLAAAARCLATCVTIAPGDDLLVSTIHTLLNYLGGSANVPSRGASGAMSIRSGLSRAVTGRDFSMTGSHSQAAIALRTDSQKELIAASTVAVVARLALEARRPDVTALTISMLLQRLRTADEGTEAAILASLVPLALAAPRSSYVDVVRALNAVSRSAMTGGANRRASGVVQQAQLRLAQGLGRLDESSELDAEPRAGDDPEADEPVRAPGRKELYLVELLQLFAEKGLQLQASVSAAKASREEAAELAVDLAGLLPALAALLDHPDLNPQLAPTTEMVSLFRNMWFLSVIFGLARPNVAPTADAVAASLARISLKTPTLVPESAKNYLESELEYNSVLKRDFGSATLEAQRKSLAALIPAHAGEIKSLGLPQVTFLLTIHHLECTRSAMGLPSMVLWYFVNEGLNASSLHAPMDAIADRVVASYLDNLSVQVGEHRLDPRATGEVRNLLLGSCHRVGSVRAVSRRFLDRLVPAYPSLLCDQDLVFTLLETLTLLRRGCEGAYRDEFAPVYHFRSARAGVSFDMCDSYAQREEMLKQFLERARGYLQTLLSRAPVELQGILQRYLATFDDDDDAGDASSPELGKSVALDFARAAPAGVGHEAHLPSLGGWRGDSSSSFVGALGARSAFGGVARNASPEAVAQCKRELVTASQSLSRSARAVPFGQVKELLYRAAALAVSMPEPDHDLLHHIVAIPLVVFTPAAIATASHVWTWIIGERPVFETKIMVEISVGYGEAIKARRGLYSSAVRAAHPLFQRVEMSESDFAEIAKERERAQRAFSPHVTLVQLLASRFQAFRYRDPAMVLALVRLLQRAAAAEPLMSNHPLSREARFGLVAFGLRVLQGSRLDGLVEFQLRAGLQRIALGWFAQSPQWSYGSNKLQLAAEMQLMRELLDLLRSDAQRSASIITSFPPNAEAVRLPGGLSVRAAAERSAEGRVLLQLLVEHELSRFSVWANPATDSPRKQADFTGELLRTMTDASWAQMVRIAWRFNPNVAVAMAKRFTAPAVRAEAGRLVRREPWRVLSNAEALPLFIDDRLKLAARESADRKWILFWAPTSPIDAVELFQPSFGNDPTLLQYAMRALEYHPVELTFFYVPQVVQALRDDEHGYVEQFIFETSKISQLFCHQIIWNMKANSFKDDDAEVPDPMKPTLDRMTERIVAALSGEAQAFYNREFGFFSEVTSISGKLKPYIKKSKAEKKAKIDEEMARIKVDPGVYLPSNPDGVVVDLARKSGRPLQSHAKAPFMATFRVRRELKGDDEDDSAAVTPSNGASPAKLRTIDVWQAAIFKVGDDCRQDVLALQCIAVMKNIFHSVGLNLYFNPYRVTATGPGMGVIDVVPNATSRDEMGRASVNDIKTFFINRYGPESSVAYQKARTNFICSVAAYSIAGYLLQIRDRHNGNIMVDGNGNIVHIDFGFLFTIGPGGMKFESEFKLSKEYIDVMGDDGFEMYKALFIRGYLALRAYVDQLVGLVHLMLATDLPSFKTGYAAIEELRERFSPNLSERDAAKFAEKLIADAYMSRRAVFYDYFQEKQNGIPWTR